MHFKQPSHGAIFSSDVHIVETVCSRERAFSTKCSASFAQEPSLRGEATMASIFESFGINVHLRLLFTKTLREVDQVRREIE